MNRAALIVSGARYIEWFDQSLGHGYTVTTEASEQLLADLDDITSHIADHNDPEYWPEVRAAAARVRALLPNEDHE